ncbi:MAG: ribose 5-phosphate isomerase B [Thermodesulfobacteriota bacterium]
MGVSVRVSSTEKIAIASDHAGREIKDDISALLREMGLEVADMGVDSDESVDYPDYGVLVARAVSEGEYGRGILVCGTGVGMSILANKFPHIRAALVGDVYTSRMVKEHNNANILVIGGRVVGKGLAREIVREWIEAEFAGGRHQRRLDKISDIEKETMK